MKSLRRCGFVALLTVACGGNTQSSNEGASGSGDSASCARGSERCACLSDGTCNEGLICGSGICVDISQSTALGGEGPGGRMNASSGGTNTEAGNGGSTSTASGGTTPHSSSTPSTSPRIYRLNIPELINSCAEIAASNWARTDSTAKRDVVLSVTPCSAFPLGDSLAPGDYFVLEGAYTDATPRALSVQAFDRNNNVVTEQSLSDRSLDELTLNRAKSSDTYTLFQYQSGSPQITSTTMTYTP